MREKHKKFNSLGLRIVACGIILGSLGWTGEIATAAPPGVPDLKIAVVYSLSGAQSRAGNLLVQGIKAAMGWVNENGGIKSLGGAKLLPVIGDAASSVEGAANAMDRVCRDPNIIMAMGSAVSAFTMASTEITERLGIPQFDYAYADALSERGFKWGFYITTPMSVIGELGVNNVIRLARAAGDDPKTAMIVGDNQVASKAWYSTARKTLGNLGIKVLGEETWAMGTLTDATPVIQKVKNSRPDIVLFGATPANEAQMCLMKRKELGIKAPFICGGGYMTDPAYLQVGAEFLEGMVAFAPFYPNKLMPEDWLKRSLNQCRKEYSDEPWVAQELTIGWAMVPIMAEILERAGSRSRQDIWETARKLDIHDVMATRVTPKQGMAFDETGRVAKKYQGVLIVQWQGGVARAIYPPDLALAKPIWVREK